MFRTFEEQVLETIRKHRLMEPGDLALVAVSGGPDSTALLHALKSLSPALRITLHAAHLNHMLRGEEAEQDARYVQQVCEDLKVPLTVEARDAGAVARARGLSIEQAARVVRYDFLDNIAQRLGANRIAVGHTADDQVETVLLNILRGAGLDGLGGMPISRGKIVRPLYEVTRTEVEHYCAELGVTPRLDSSNLSREIPRNRLRLDILPGLEQEYPALRRHLLSLASLARAESAYLTDLARKRMQRILLRKGAEELVLSANRLRRLPAVLQRRVIREAVRELKGDLAHLEYGHVDAILELSAGRTGRRLDLPMGLRAAMSYGQLSLSVGAFREHEPAEVLEAVNVPGCTVVEALGVELEAELSGPARVRDEGPQRAVLDYEKVRGPIFVRTWRRGDRFHPLGAPGRMKLHDFFINEKIAREQRRRIPLLADAQGIIWVVGHRIDERCKVTEQTRTVLRMGARPIREQSVGYQGGD